MSLTDGRATKKSLQHPTSEEAMSRGKGKVQKRKAELVSADSRMSFKLKGKKHLSVPSRCHQAWRLNYKTDGG